MVHRKLLWTAWILCAVFGVALIASGEDAEKADFSALSAEERRAARLEADKNRPRYKDVRYVKATPLAQREDGLRAPPSTTIIEYDNNAAVLRSGNTGTVVVGNQFNVGGGGNPITGPWTITGFVVQNAGPAFPPTTPSAGVVFFGGPGAGTSAPFLAYVSGVPLTGGIQAFGLATPITGTGSFLGGVVNSSYPACTVTSVPPGTTCDGPALDTAQNSTNPLGFHAMSIAAFVIPGTNFATLGNLNAIFKVTGSNLPVELTSFSVGSE